MFWIRFSFLKYQILFLFLSIYFVTSNECTDGAIKYIPSCEGDRYAQTAITLMNICKDGEYYTAETWTDDCTDTSKHAYGSLCVICYWEGQMDDDALILDSWTLSRIQEYPMNVAMCQADSEVIVQSCYASAPISTAIGRKTLVTILLPIVYYLFFT
mmetsp:Transcript_2078/g.4519  ORF Transcript_2078/g.4519 Transcript_2078/m.4519 type:complete len:157 (-) Transcript_2078:201-671(-)